LHGVDLVDEEDGALQLARGGEELADALCAHTNIFFFELRSIHAEEGHASLARNGAREQSFAWKRRRTEK
jgi:hypothetical protein